MGIFDTVAQIGVPNDWNYQFGYDLTVDADKIGFTAHAVAENEYRSLFPLTSILSSYLSGAPYFPGEFTTLHRMNYFERPFAGAHSDIGGGYQDFRNLDALKWMIQRGQKAGAPFADLSDYRHKNRLQPLTTPHDSRYPVLDRYPWTHIGRGPAARTVFSGNL
jgi:hypothetical protein